MARSLARDGHEVAVWNRTRARADEAAGDGVTAYDGVGEAVAGADVVITMLLDTDSVLAATQDLVAALAPDAVWLQCSTVGPDGMARIAAAASTVPASTVPDRLLDAPVRGTRKPAEDGSLVVLLAGPEGARQAATPALEAVGSRTVLVGDAVGAAARSSSRATPTSRWSTPASPRPWP